MVQRRSAVITADTAGDSAQITNRLLDLQRYVSAHMNTDLGAGVYLESSYNRDYQRAVDVASSDSNPNGNIYKKAQEVCAPRFNRYSTAYLQCTLSELEKYPASSTLQDEVNGPDPSLYRHDYVSPVWTPDFAGFSVLATGLIALIIIVRLISLGVLRVMLRWHYKSI